MLKVSLTYFSIPTIMKVEAWRGQAKNRKEGAGMGKLSRIAGRLVALGLGCFIRNGTGGGGRAHAVCIAGAG